MSSNGSAGPSSSSPVTADGDNPAPRLRSFRSTVHSFVRFWNRTQSRRVQVMWLNYKGDRVVYTAISPNNFLDVNTFETHPWVFQDADTGDRLMAMGKEVFEPPPFNLKEQGWPPERTPVNIHVPVYRLQERCVQVLKDVVSPERLQRAPIPSIIKQEIQAALDRQHTLRQQAATQQTIGQQAGQQATGQQTGQQAGQQAIGQQTGQQTGQHTGQHTTGQHTTGRQAGRHTGRHTGQHTTGQQAGRHTGQQTGQHPGQHTSQQATGQQTGQHTGQQAGRHTGQQTGQHPGQHTSQQATGQHAGQQAGQQTTGQHAGQHTGQHTSQQTGQQAGRLTTGLQTVQQTGQHMRINQRLPASQEQREEEDDVNREEGGAHS